MMSKQNKAIRSVGCLQQYPGLDTDEQHQVPKVRTSPFTEIRLVYLPNSSVNKYITEISKIWRRTMPYWTFKTQTASCPETPVTFSHPTRRHTPPLPP